MTKLIRNDIHRPGQINPSDYQYVAIEHDRVPSFGFCPEWAAMVAANRKVINDHMARTGGTYSDHDHAGNCMVCGAHCIYTVLFYHPQTNVYIRTGFDCADKMGIGDERLFRAFKRTLEECKLSVAGKRKAQAILADEGLSEAWDIYTAKHPECDCGYFDNQHTRNCACIMKFEERTISDIVGKLVKYGSVSPKQLQFVRNLLKQLATRDERQAKYAAEKAKAQDVPSGRQTIVCEVLKTDLRDTAYGSQWKMLVKSVDSGYTLWGTVPSALVNKIARGDKIQLTAKLVQSEDDTKFGFFSRPSAKLLETQQPALAQ